MNITDAKAPDGRAYEEFIRAQGAALRAATSRRPTAGPGRFARKRCAAPCSPRWGRSRTSRATWSRR